MITWTACHYDSTLYSCNVTGMTICQHHLSTFDDEVMRFYEKEKQKGFNI
jgi:flavorubredoxin